MSDCFAQVLKYLEPILNKNIFGLRTTALKTFSALIGHCRNTNNVDDEIRKTRKGLSNIAMDYISGLVTLYTTAGETFDEPIEMDDGSKKKNKTILPG